MPFLVLVVQRGGLVKIAHHIARGIGRLAVPTFVGQVLLQAIEQTQHAVDPFMTGRQHVKGRFKARIG